MSNEKNIYFIRPHLIDDAYLAYLFRSRFHSLQDVQESAKKLYPKGLNWSNEEVFNSQSKHILCDVFEFVPYKTSLSFEEVLEKGKDFGLKESDVVLLSRSQSTEDTVIRKVKPNIDPSFETSMSQTADNPETESYDSLGSDEDTKTTTKTEFMETTKVNERNDNEFRKFPQYLESSDKRIVSVNTTSVKMSGSATRELTPEWKTDPLNPGHNDALLRNFFRQLRRARDQGWFRSKTDDTDELLITMAINKSGRQDLFSSMNQQELTDLEKFITFLQNSEGRTREEVREQLRNCSQMQNESYQQLLGRIVVLFADLRGWDESPSLQQLATEDKYSFEAAEIISHFLEAVMDQRVKSLLKQQRPELNVNNIATIAKRLQGSLPPLQTRRVNLTERQNDPLLSERLEKTETAIALLISKFDAKGGKKKTNKAKIRCEHCNKPNHKIDSCWLLHPNLKPNRSKKAESGGAKKSSK